MGFCASCGIRCRGRAVVLGRHRLDRLRFGSDVPGPRRRRSMDRNLADARPCACVWCLASRGFRGRRERTLNESGSRPAARSTLRRQPFARYCRLWFFRCRPLCGQVRAKVVGNHEHNSCTPRDGHWRGHVGAALAKVFALTYGRASMSPSEVEHFLEQDPMPPIRVELASGREFILFAEHQAFVAGLTLVLRGIGDDKEITSRSRLVSIPNIVMMEPAGPGAKRLRRRRT